MTVHASAAQEIQLAMHEDAPMVTSMTIAEKFGKRHADVLRAIENTKKDCSAGFTERNFALSDYLDSTGRTLPMVLLTKDGFAMLMMRFTGAKAGAWREKFIDAFNRMERYISEEIHRKARQAEQRGQLEWQMNRATGKVVRHELTDAIKVFVEYAKAQGSRSADTYYLNVSKMINDAILGKQANKDPHFRDGLDAGQLMLLANAEKLAGQVLLESMQAALPYKACFQAAKEEVTKLAKLMRRAGSTLLLGGPANAQIELSVAV